MLLYTPNLQHIIIYKHTCLTRHPFFIYTFSHTIHKKIFLFFSISCKHFFLHLVVCMEDVKNGNMISRTNNSKYDKRKKPL